MSDNYTHILFVNSNDKPIRVIQFHNNDVVSMFQFTPLIQRVLNEDFCKEEFAKSILLRKKISLPPNKVFECLEQMIREEFSETTKLMTRKQFLSQIGGISAEKSE